MQEAYEIGQLAGTYAIRIIAAIVVLFLGWVTARFTSRIFRKGLERSSLGNKLSTWLAGREIAEDIESEKRIANGIYYLIMLFVLVAFFQVLGITLITEPLNSFLKVISEYLPRILGAVLLFIVAWVVAAVVRIVIRRVLGATKLDKKVGEEIKSKGTKTVTVSETLSEIAYWLVFLLFLPAILSALALQGLLEPVNGMVYKILAFLPNLLVAALIILLGWFLARIIQRIVSNLLAAIGTNQLSEKVGLERFVGKIELSRAIGLVVYVLILIPVLIAALDALQLAAITQPASNMLSSILMILPEIFAALLVIAIAYIVGQVVCGLIANLLSSIGFDTILSKIGLAKGGLEQRRKPSSILGHLILVAIMMFAFMESMSIIGFTSLAQLTFQFLIFASHIIVGLIILGIGLYLANLASNIISSSKSSQAGLLAVSAKVSIIILATAIALGQMGLANDIVNLAFGLLIGAIAVAVAIAFGLGGREIAARKLKDWTKSIDIDSDKKEPE